MHGLLLKIKLALKGVFLAELVVYAFFVMAYYFLVLQTLGARVKQVFDENRLYYAILALALILVQGVFLEMLTSALVRVFSRKKR